MEQGKHRVIVKVYDGLDLVFKKEYNNKSCEGALMRLELDAGIKALYSDVQNDELIDEVAAWFKEGNLIGTVSANLNSLYGLPYELSQKIIALGYKRSEEIARSEEFSNVKNQAIRLDNKYEKELVDMEGILQELENHQSYIENH